MTNNLLTGVTMYHQNQVGNKKRKRERERERERERG